MVDPDTFRQVMGQFAAGVTVVTLPAPHHGITVNAFASVSLDPPLVLVCLDHDTEAYRRLSDGAGGYCVNVLGGDQRALGEHFADMISLDPEPFEAQSTTERPSGALSFDSAVAYLDCDVEAAHEAGDHTIYVGAVSEAAVQRPDVPVLTYFRGAWGELG